MVTRKTAIAIPEEILAELDRAAELRGESRSRYITRLLRLGVQTTRDADVTRRLDELFARADMCEDQRRTTEELDAAGSDWSERGW